MDVLKHLSISSIGTYMRCGYQWYFRYVMEKKIPPGLALVRGASFHVAFEENFRQKIDTEKDLPCEHVKEIFSGSYDAALQSADIKKDEDPGKVKDLSMGAVEEFHKTIAPKIQPELVEYASEIEVAGIPFISRIDLLDRDEAIRDLKCSAKSPPKDVAETSMQLTGYDLTYRKLYGRPPKKLALDYAVTTKTPKSITYECGPRNIDALNSFEDHVAIVLDAIKKGVFMPAPEDSWVCSQKYCGYWDICKFGSKRRKK